MCKIWILLLSIILQPKFITGPNQVLATEQDSTWEPDGRVRIKYNPSKPYEPLSIPGALSRTVKKFPDHPALITKPGVDGRRTTITYKLVLVSK